jgi:hypothetical protein
MEEEAGAMHGERHPQAIGPGEQEEETRVVDKGRDGETQQERDPQRPAWAVRRRGSRCREIHEKAPHSWGTTTR